MADSARILKSCISCGNSLTIDYFYKDKQKVDGFSPRCKDCDKRQRKVHYINNKELSVNNNLLRKYSISYEEYMELFNKQSGHCYICLIHQRDLKRAMAVDHNHKTGNIRGLLCNSCNVAIGNAKESIEILQRMIDYLKEKGSKND